MLACLTDPPAAPAPAEEGRLPVLLADRARLIAMLRQADHVRAEAEAVRADVVELLREVDALIRAEREQDGG